MTYKVETWQARAIAQLESVIEFSEDERQFGVFGRVGRTLADRSRSIAELEARCMSAIFSVTPEGSPNRARALQLSRSGAVLEGNPDRYDDIVVPLVGIVSALLSDVRAGYLTEVAEQIRSEFSADLLSLANTLLTDGPRFKDPAAVITGVLLEHHLQRLAVKHSIELDEGGRPKKADTLNADLAKKSAYNPARQKSITSWLQIRNDSVHCRWEAYTFAQVELMLQGVTDFVASHPA